MDAILGLFYLVAGAVGAVLGTIVVVMALWTLARGAVEVLAWFIDPS